ERTFVKKGDGFTVEYRLLPGMIPRPIKTGKVDARAQADGDDVLGTIVAQLAPTLASAAASAPPDKRMAKMQSENTSNKTSNNNKQGRGSQPPSNMQLPPGMDCEQMATISRGSVTVESCKQMMAAGNAYNAALNDPRASKPGDDKMTCDQIA